MRIWFYRAKKDFPGLHYLICSVMFSSNPLRKEQIRLEHIDVIILWLLEAVSCIGFLFKSCRVKHTEHRCSFFSALICTLFRQPCKILPLVLLLHMCLSVIENPLALCSSVLLYATKVVEFSYLPGGFTTLFHRFRRYLSQC